MRRRNGSPNQITLEYIDAKLDARLDRFEEKLTKVMQAEADRHAAYLDKMEVRLAADRKETAERLEREHKAAEARQAATESRLVEERKEARREYNSQKF